MATDYKLRIYNRSGVLQYEIVDFRALGYTRQVNAPGMATVVLDGAHPAVAAVDLDWQLEVWRRNPAFRLDWTCDFYGLIRDTERTSDEKGIQTATLYAPGSLHLLQRAIVAYKTGDADRSLFTADPAETIAKALVTYNATSSGTVLDGRLRAVNLTGISVQADAAGGNTLDMVCSYQNLLSALQEIAAIGGGDFDLVKTGAAAWEFRWYSGQLGTDRSATVTFALGYGNMAGPTLKRNTLNERTVAIVGGQGEADSRTVEVRTGANYAAGYNGAEMFVEGRSYSTTAGLQGAGDRALDEAKARYSLEFDVIQTPASVYGVHYGLGDLVTAQFEEYSATKKIVSVTVEAIRTGGETIKVGMADT